MYHYSKTSLKCRTTCHPMLWPVLDELIKHVNIRITWGWRGKQAQNEAFLQGLSSYKFPNGQHNLLIKDTPASAAFDFVPWHSEPPFIRWEDTQMFSHVAGRIMGIADGLGVKLRWGGNWNGNMDLKDQSFFDLGHMELHYTQEYLTKAFV